MSMDFPKIEDKVLMFMPYSAVLTGLTVSSLPDLLGRYVERRRNLEAISHA
jgi:hypothetical protein